MEVSLMNKFKEMLSKDENPLGIFVDTASSYVVECLGRTGFDYIIIDNEHSPVDAETTAELVKAAELSGLTPFARVREIQRSAILKCICSNRFETRPFSNRNSC